MSENDIPRGFFLFLTYTDGEFRFFLCAVTTSEVLISIITTYIIFKNLEK